MQANTRRWLTDSRRLNHLVAAIVMLLIALLGPAPQHADAAGLASAAPADVACRLAPRLSVGDAVTLVKGAPNRIRQAPGVASARTGFRVTAGSVWYVLAGPVCKDGMNWYQVGQGDAVGWTSEGAPVDGYYLGRAATAAGGGAAAACQANYASRLNVGMLVTVQGGQQRVRAKPTKSGAQVASLASGQAVKLIASPQCADGWVWWRVASTAGRTLGWTSEGDEAGYWLVPQVTAVPKLARTYAPADDGHFAVTFAPDGEAATVAFDNLGADTYPEPNTYAPGARRKLTFPLTGAGRGAFAKVSIVGLIACDAGGRATAYGMIGGQRFRVSCDAAHPMNTDLIQSVNVRLPANAPLVIDLNVEAGSGSKAGWGFVEIHVVDFEIDPV